MNHFVASASSDPSNNAVKKEVNAARRVSTPRFPVKDFLRGIPSGDSPSRIAFVSIGNRSFLRAGKRCNDANPR